jgi:hypothetical protein
MSADSRAGPCEEKSQQPEIRAVDIQSHAIIELQGSGFQMESAKIEKLMAIVISRCEN